MHTEKRRKDSRVDRKDAEEIAQSVNKIDQSSLDALFHVELDSHQNFLKAANDNIADLEEQIDEVCPRNAA